MKNERTSLFLNTNYSDAEIFDAELEIANKLQWDLAAIVPHDYTDLLLDQIPFDNNSEQRYKIRIHVNVLLCLATFELKYSQAILPSLLTCGCIKAAIKGLYPTKFDLNQIDNILVQITKSNKNDILSTQKLVEFILKTYLQDIPVQSSSPRRCLAPIENNNKSPKTPKRLSVK